MLTQAPFCLFCESWLPSVTTASDRSWGRPSSLVCSPSWPWVRSPREAGLWRAGPRRAVCVWGEGAPRHLGHRWSDGVAAQGRSQAWGRRAPGGEAGLAVGGEGGAAVRGERKLLEGRLAPSEGHACDLSGGRRMDPMTLGVSCLQPDAAPSAPCPAAPSPAGPASLPCSPPPPTPT